MGYFHVTVEAQLHISLFSIPHRFIVIKPLISYYTMYAPRVNIPSHETTSVCSIITPKGCSAAYISVLPNGHMRITASNCRAVAGFDANVSCVIKNIPRCVPDYLSQWVFITVK
ncbi:hypothetical protein T12_13777 [Trichinella patagoniensis]|uniref:Uncharacterized protein n=1 Tax=Trichinella patagoniensis TaxID=990121 RepID=A0A0V0Z9C8_9BILA|nr:hypothetical protein T12_13777 [Trichinella patagoniensis]